MGVYPLVERLQPPIIKDQKVGAAEIAQKAWMSSVPARQREVLEQPGHALVEDGPIVATGFVAKRRRQPTFAAKRFTAGCTTCWYGPARCR
jgi:hypothetical protein